MIRSLIIYEDHTMNDCLFCQIAKKETPVNIIYEDKYVIVFDDIHPKAPIHKLIIPKVHIATVNDITPKNNELLGHMIHTAKEVAKKLGIAENGYRLIMNCNTDAGQVIFHMHIHLLGGRSLSWHPG